MRRSPRRALGSPRPEPLSDDDAGRLVARPVFQTQVAHAKKREVAKRERRQGAPLAYLQRRSRRVVASATAVSAVGRPVGLESLWSLVVTFPADGRIERDICVVSAAELRHHLLRDTRQLERASAPPPGVRTDAAATDVSARPFDRRAAGLLLRDALYLCVGLAFFLLVTWLLSVSRCRSTTMLCAFVVLDFNR